MDYYRLLFEATAYLLLIEVQMREYPFSGAVSRFLSEDSYEAKARAVERIAVVHALDRTGEPMCADIIDEIEEYVAKFDVAAFPENERSIIEADLKTARSVIEWYRNTPGKIK